MRVSDSSKISLWDFRQNMFIDIVPIEEVEDLNGDPITNILPYWRKKGLVPFLPKGQWTLNVTFAEIIWFRILDELRRFSLPVEKIKIVADYFFSDAYNKNLARENLKEVQKRLQLKKKTETLTIEEQGMLLVVEKSLKDEEYLAMMARDVNYLHRFIMRSIESGEEASILIFSDGSVAEKYGEKCDSHTKGEIDLTQPHIRLSLSHFLGEFFDHGELTKAVTSNSLTIEEKKVLKEIRTNNIKELKITLDKGRIIKMDTTKDGIITGEQAEKIKLILGMKNYEKIELSTRDEKTLFFKKTKKK